MRNISIGIILLTSLTGCLQSETGTNMANVFPTFKPSEEEYLANLSFADSIDGSFEYKHSSSLFGSSEENIAVIDIYIDSEMKINANELKKIENQLIASETQISNLTVYDKVNYKLIQNAKEIHVLEKDIVK